MKKNYLMTDHYQLQKVLDEIKMIVGIEKIDDSEILYNTDNELANEVT